MKHIDFENIEEKFDAVQSQESWATLAKEFDDSDDIYVVANGGLWSCGNHAADDCTRLFAKAGIKKNVNSLDSQCLITSVANDYGYNNVFLRWLELQKVTGKMSDNPMIIGLSCSGNSKNIVSCLHWAKNNGYKNALISGAKSTVLPDGYNEVCFDCKYFHTTEILSLILFYDLIHYCGAVCPSIKDEIVRKGAAESLSRNPLD
tara:strand:+ start:805 stop:1416 length:612 start_codon:yes stop_codon:yes gene_type:complete